MTPSDPAGQVWQSLRFWRGQRPPIRQRALTTLLPIALIALTTQLMPAWSRALATPASSLRNDVQAPEPSQQSAVRPPPIEVPPPTAQKIVVRKPAVTPGALEAAPVATGSLAEPHDVQTQKIHEQLQRLKRQAESARIIGSTPSSAQAAWILGLIYLHGAGVRRDPPLAQQWFQRAAHLGREPWAYAGLAWCAIDGCVGPPNVEEANRTIALLHRRYPARADYLTWVLASREAPVQAPNRRLDQEAAPTVPDLALLQRAGAAGDAQANLELGIIAATDHRQADAERYFLRAGPQSRAAAIDLQLLKSRRQEEASAAHPTPVANADAAQALAMAHRYHRGMGVPVNFSEAIRFYRLAAARGSAEAKRMLALIYSNPMPNGNINVAWMQQLAYVDPQTPIPNLPAAPGPQVFQRDPTPLFDLMPAFWRQQLTQVER